MVYLARSYDGVGMAKSPAKYIELVATGEKKQVQDWLAAESGCGLILRGFLRIEGLTDPRIHPPYKAGRVIADLIDMAQEKKAWVSDTTKSKPLPGDFVYVGGGPTEGGVQHIYVVTAVDADGTIHSIDGGQRDSEKNLQLIKQRSRQWQVKSGRNWDIPKLSNDPGARNAAGRRVQGWIDLEKFMEAWTPSPG